MIDMFVNGKVFIAPDLDINNLIAAGLNEEEIEEKLNAKAQNNPKNASFRVADFRPEYIEMLRKDQEILERMYSANSTTCSNTNCSRRTVTRKENL